MTQQEAFDVLKLGHNVFLTGPAGSGKTYLLNQYIAYLREHGVGVAVTASTGIASTHLGGQTIHSWSGIGISDAMDDSDLIKIVSNSRIKRNFKKTKVLIIDEISMLHPYQLDMVERIARRVYTNDESFGGMQIVLCGDFFQLPPVAQGVSQAQKKFAYECEAWEAGEFSVCYLHEQFRQGDDPLLDVLNAIREGRASEDVKVPLRTRYKKDPEGEVLPTRLYSKNVNVDAINAAELKKLSTREGVFTMEANGFMRLVDALKRSCLAPEELRLKIGAEVMFVKNSTTGEYVNGTRAVVEGFDENDGFPIVQTFDGRRLTVYPEEWRFEEDGAVRASLRQVPLRLAWAITIHKSQGMTLDAAEIDLSDAFEPGMGYVALSRVRGLSGLKLMGLNDIALSVHPKILEYDQKFKERSEQARAVLEELSADKKIKQHDDVLIRRFGGAKDTKKVVKGKRYKKPTYEVTREYVEEKLSLADIVKKRGLTVGTILGHLERLQGMKQLPDIEYLRPANKDFNNIKKAFKKFEDGKLAPVFEELKEKYSFEALRLARLFIVNI